MSETNKGFIRRFYDDVFTAGNLAAVDELVSADCVEHAPLPGLTAGDTRDALKAFVTTLRTATPDVQVRAEVVIAEGDLVAAYWTAEGTHDSELMGIPATGTQVRFGGLDLVRVVDGRCTEHWGFDGLALQLGGQTAPV